MKLPVDKKNFAIIQIGIGFCLTVGMLIGHIMRGSIYKACFTNARVI